MTDSYFCFDLLLCLFTFLLIPLFIYFSISFIYIFWNSNFFIYKNSYILIYVFIYVLFSLCIFPHLSPTSLQISVLLLFLHFFTHFCSIMQMSAAAIQSQSQSITVWEDNVYLHNEAEMYKEM